MLDRSNFLYLEPSSKKDTFQCGSCKMFLAEYNLCSLHGKKVTINANDSCNLWCYGGPADESEIEHVKPTFTPEQSGLVKNQKVTCKNCEYFNPKESECMVFCILGLEDEVKPDACCNAWSPKEENEPKEHAKPSNVLSKIKLPNTKK